MGKSKNFKGNPKADAASRNSDKKSGGMPSRGNRPKRGQWTQGKCDDVKDNFQKDNKFDKLNDISWYSRNPKLLQAAGSFPYPYRPGMALGQGFSYIDASSETPTSGTSYAPYIPGALAINWVPSIGNAIKLTDPASVTANQIYSKVREAYSGDLIADPQDFMMYLMALDSIFSYIAYLKRIYRVIDAYSQDNRFIPAGLMQAVSQLSPTALENLRINKTRFWQEINTLVLQSRRFKCPAFMDVFNRHYWMNDNVWLDHPTARGQMYVFRPDSLFIYSEVPAADDAQTMVSGLKYKAVPVPTGNVNDVDLEYYQYGLDLINALTAWDECYTINGYLERAYGDTPSFIVDEIEMGDPLTPLYAEEVLSQIENANVLDYTIDFPTAITVTQMTTESTVVCDLSNVPVNTNLLVSHGSIINMHVDEPTVADTVIASRMATVAEPISDGKHIKISCGTEIATAMYLYTGWYYNNQYNVVPQRLYTYNLNPTSGYFSTMVALTQFDWHPFLFVLYAGNATVMLGDVYNATEISANDMKNLHDVCLYSEFGSFNI